MQALRYSRSIHLIQQHVTPRSLPFFVTSCSSSLLVPSCPKALSSAGDPHLRQTTLSPRRRRRPRSFYYSRHASFVPALHPLIIPSPRSHSRMSAGASVNEISPLTMSRAATDCATVGSFPSDKVPLSDTIYALSSGGGGAVAGVAVIRISGCRAKLCLGKLLQQGSPVPEPRVASLRRLLHPVTSEVLDHALVLWFPGPRSFTGEDVVELHLHGSRAVVAGVTEALSATGEARPAERGEFTRRAFENGRMDLTEVEGLADLLAADTASQRRQALRQLGGDVRTVFEGWREEAKGILAHAEAVIDFGDDVDDGAFEAVLPRVVALRQEMIRRVCNDGGRGEIVRGGVRVAIVGRPNAGKSTLLNALARREAAIVSPVAGTTRDIVEVVLDVEGIAVTVSDTAGIRDVCGDDIEREGMRRARQAAQNADVRIVVVDASADGGWEEASRGGISVVLGESMLEEAGLSTTDESSHNVHDAPTPTTIVIANKCDVAGSAIGDAESSDVICASLKEGDGVDDIFAALGEAVRARVGTDGCGDADGGEAPVITRARHRYHVERAVRALQTFEEGRSGEERAWFLPMDLATEELRICCKELGAVTGVIHVEEVLDVIFNDFCIGK